MARSPGVRMKDALARRISAARCPECGRTVMFRPSAVYKGEADPVVVCTNMAHWMGPLSACAPSDETDTYEGVLMI